MRWLRSRDTVRRCGDKHWVSTWRETPRNIIKHTPEYVCEGFCRNSWHMNYISYRNQKSGHQDQINKQPKGQAGLPVHTKLSWVHVFWFGRIFCFFGLLLLTSTDSGLNLETWTVSRVYLGTSRSSDLDWGFLMGPSCLEIFRVTTSFPVL